LTAPSPRSKLAAPTQEAAIDFVDALRLPVRAGIAAGLAVGAATVFSLGSPLYAVVSAVIVTDVEASQTRRLALPRMIGTAVGASVGCLATLLVQPGVLAVAVGVLLPMFLCQLLRQPAAAKVAGYVSGIIILSFSANPWEHARDRVIETVVGIVAAFAVSAVPVLYRKAAQGSKEQ
jgi:uncharacterized membrane protein YgaE (UPF0421/DUF939 family)